MRSLLLVLFFLCFGAGLANAQIIYHPNVAKPAAKDTVKPYAKPVFQDKPTQYVKAVFDTIPLNRKRFFQVDDQKYLLYKNARINDSVKLQLADNTDWNDFASAYAELQSTLQKNPFDNVSSYLDPDKDFSELKLMNQQFLPFTAKVCLRQLIFNLQVTDKLLNSDLSSPSDVETLGLFMDNIGVLISKYIMIFGATNLYSLRAPNVVFKVFNKDGSERTNAKCFLVSPKTCRDITCKTCMLTANPCDQQKVVRIAEKKDAVFDCANPAPIPVPFGPYHLFVVSENALLSYELWDVNESTAGEKKVFLPK